MEHQHDHEQVSEAPILDEGEIVPDMGTSRAHDHDPPTPNDNAADMQDEVEADQDSAIAALIQAEKEEVDSRSIYVGNVDYSCTPEEVEQHFQSCGTVNRLTILTNKFCQPKGFAYVEFAKIDAVQGALLLNESELHGRQLKVSAKRTNVPGMKQHRGRRFSPYDFQGQSPFMPGPLFSSTDGYGKVSRYRRSVQYRPYN